MAMRRIECAVSFNVWNGHGSWFWSLVYPGRHGGAIGAAASEAEAVGEAQDAIERLSQLHADNEKALEAACVAKRACGVETSKSSHSDIVCNVDSASDALPCSQAARKQGSSMRTDCGSYKNFWQFSLHQYAERVAAE